MLFTRLFLGFSISIMVRCLYASCSSDSRSQEKIKFFRLPTEQAIAKLWFNRSRRADLTFEKLSKRHSVCHKHFEANQVERQLHGMKAKLFVKKGEIPLVNGRMPKHPVILPTVSIVFAVCQIALI